MKLTIRKPDDMHLHLRDGPILKRVVGHSAADFGRALIMPNLAPPLATAAMVEEYRRRIMTALPTGADFVPLMTIYLTDDTDPADVARAISRGLIAAVKLYPAGATTNSANGVTDVDRVRGVFEVLADTGVPLCVHGEVAEFDVDVFDREKVFIERVLERITSWSPRLRIVLEHVTTIEGLSYTRANHPRMAATITVHHLIINRNHLFRNGLRPHYYCLPVAKREHHRLAILDAATGGETCFFLGTDSAPHLVSDKECAAGCAGIYTAPVALPCLAQLFEATGSLGNLERFAALNGARFYGLKPNEQRITLVKSGDVAAIDRYVAVGEDRIAVFDPEFDIRWRVERNREIRNG